jgi:hypothetical protein
MADITDARREAYLELIRRGAAEADIRKTAAAAGIPADAVEVDLQFLTRARVLWTDVDMLLSLCNGLAGIGGRLTEVCEAFDHSIGEYERALAGLVKEASDPLAEACKSVKGMHMLVKLMRRRPELFSGDAQLLLVALGKTVTPVISAHQAAAVSISLAVLRNHLQRIAAGFRGAARSVDLIPPEWRQEDGSDAKSKAV